MPHISFRETNHSTAETGNIVTCVTDIPSHIWLRWTILEPWIHRKPSYRRGIYLNDDVRFCFDVYNDVEQDEAGDTYIHTFTIAPCVTGRLFWYYLWGYVNGVLAPSTSPILKYPSTLICPDTLVLSVDGLPCNRTIRRSWGTWPLTHDFPTGDIFPYHDSPWYSCIASTSRTASYWISRAYLAFPTHAIPVGSTIIDALLVLFVISKKETSRSDYRNIIATQGVQDTPVVPENYGDQLPYTDNGGQVNLADCIPDEVTVINLNSTGKSWVIPGDISYFCIRQELDVLDIYPTLGANTLQFGSAQNDYWKRPKLVIRYSPPK